MNMTPNQLRAGRPDEIARRIADHPFADGFDAHHVEALAGSGSEIEVAAGRFVFKRGQLAHAFYLITAGDLALEIEQPGQGPLVLETLHTGDALGWSWLFEPYRWQLDAHATSDLRAVALDAARLRDLIDTDPAFGLEVVLRLARHVVGRLHHARSQLASVQVR